jgi:hypothetical protein
MFQTSTTIPLLLQESGLAICHLDDNLPTSDGFSVSHFCDLRALASYPEDVRVRASALSAKRASQSSTALLEGIPVLLQGRKRIICHPVDDNLPSDRFAVSRFCDSRAQTSYPW